MLLLCAGDEGWLPPPINRQLWGAGACSVRVVAIAVGPMLLLLLLIVATATGVRQLWHGITAATAAAARVWLLTAVVGPVKKEKNSAWNVRQCFEEKKYGNYGSATFFEGSKFVNLHSRIMDLTFKNTIRIMFTSSNKKRPSTLMMLTMLCTRLESLKTDFLLCSFPNFRDFSPSSCVRFPQKRISTIPSVSDSDPDPHWFWSAGSGSGSKSTWNAGSGTGADS